MKLSYGLIAGLLFVTLAGYPAHGSAWAFSESMPGRHRGPVNAIAHRGDTIISAGTDGFLEIWSMPPRSSEWAGRGRFQVSSYRLSMMAARPDKDEVCLVYSDALGLYRIAVWNYRERRNVFTIESGEPISHINYSAGGSFIIAGRTGRNAVLLIDADSGQFLQPMQTLIGSVGLSATGRSERSMMIYQPGGSISYWNIETGSQNAFFNAPANLLSPVLFSNDRFLAGLSAEGLTVVHASTGEVLGRDSAIPIGALLCSADDELLCLVQSAGSPAALHRYTINNAGRLIQLGQSFLSASEHDSNPSFSAIGFSSAARAGQVALGSMNGGPLAVAGKEGQMQSLRGGNQLRIADAAVSGSMVAFITEHGKAGFIPLNFNQLNARYTIQAARFDENVFNRISPFPAANGNDAGFIFWQDSNTQVLPVISGPGAEPRVLSGINLRSPLRSLVSFDGRVQCIDSMGNISVINIFDSGAPFTFFSVGLMDAAFIDRDRILIGRSAVGGNTPFLLINVNTGETVPLHHPSQAGLALHRGASGSIYAAVISPQHGNEALGMQTSILRINPEDIAGSAVLAEFQGEETQFSFAETRSGFAANIGGESTAIYSGGASAQLLERSPGFPRRLSDSGQHLMKLDTDGNVTWHDSRSGRMLALFRLHENGWSIQTEQRTIRGNF